MSNAGMERLKGHLHYVLYEWMIKKIKAKRTNPILKLFLILIYISIRIIVLGTGVLLTYYAFKDNFLLGLLFLAITIMFLILFINTARIEFFTKKKKK